MATVNLGAIKFNWKGAYDNSATYAVDDVVSSGGSSYICILASQGNAVTNGTYWSVMAQAGTDGTNVATTITTQGDILYRDGSGLARLAAGTSGQFLKTQGTGANPVWGDVVAKLLQCVSYEYTTRDSVSAVSGDQALRTWTTGFVKQSATSKLYIWNINPTFQSNQGTQQVYQKFTHTDGTVSEIFGSRIYQYSANQNSTLIGMQGIATGLKAGTYTIVLTSASNGNNHNGQFVINPNGSDDNRNEYSGDAQSNTGTAGSKSTIIIQEIE